MDEETKKRFDQVDERFEQVDKRFEQVDERFERVDKRFDRLEGEVASGFASLAKLIEDHTASLEREMRSGFERLDAATARNTKVLTGGSKSVAALIAWSERQDAKELKQDEEIRDLRSRVEKLERRVG